MIPYMVGKLAPNPTHSTRGLVKYVSGTSYFCAVSSQNGDKFVTSPHPSIVERVNTHDGHTHTKFCDDVFQLTDTTGTAADSSFTKNIVHSVF